MGLFRQRCQAPWIESEPKRGSVGSEPSNAHAWTADPTPPRSGSDSISEFAYAHYGVTTNRFSFVYSIATVLDVCVTTTRRIKGGCLKYVASGSSGRELGDKHCAIDVSIT